MRTRSVEAPCLRADRDGPLRPELRAAAAGQGRPGDRRNAGACGAVSALWLPAHPHLPAAPGPSPGLAPGPPAVAAGRAAVATPSAAASGGDQSAPAVAGGQRQLRVGLRLRVRCLRQWPADQVSDNRRRVHPRVPGHRCGWLDPLAPGHRGAGPTHQHPRHTALPALGQRPGVRLRGRCSSGCSRKTSKPP